MKRFSNLLCAILLCLLLPVTALAADAVSLDLAAGSIEIYEREGVTYCVQNGVTQTTTGGVIIRQSNSGSVATSNTVTVSDGSCKVTISSLNIQAESKKSSILVEEGASLDLNLLGSSTVTGGKSCAGIQVPEGASITIGGSGSITATGGGGGAGIGGGQEDDGGTVTINGGTVTAKTGGGGAGIGGGDSGDYEGDGGTITINGGTVTGIGDYWGAGIGGGGHGDAGSIIINGGEVIADGNIGASSTGTGGAININGGVIIVSIGIYSDESITISGGHITFNTKPGHVSSIDADKVTISEKAIVTGEVPYIRETIFIDNQSILPLAARLGNTPLAFVAARGHSGLSYQWQTSTDKKNWTDFEGQTSAEVSFTMTEELDSAYLRCKLTNGWDNVQYTDPVQIYVLAFSQQPTSVDANLNDMVVFEALSTCSNVTYRWQRSYDDDATWADIPGETYSTFIINATLSESTAKYRCVITATNGDQLASDEVCTNVSVTDAYEYTVKTYLQDLETMDYVFHEQYTANGAVQIGGYEGFSENGARRVQEGVLENGTLVIHCYFDRNTYSIIFDTNGGGSLPALEALYGAPVEAPGEPARYGHIFAGWYADKALTEAFVFDTMPLDGATVYAKWTPVGADRGIEYTVNGLSLRDSTTFEVLEGIPKGKFLVEVSVTNLSATQTDTVLLVYYTAQGQMVGMNYMFANTPVGYTAVFGAAVDNSGGNIGIIRAFVLPTLGNPTPLADGVNEIR